VAWGLVCFRLAWQGLAPIKASSPGPAEKSILPFLKLKSEVLFGCKFFLDLLVDF
jgi:hypothetical protein